MADTNKLGTFCTNLFIILTLSFLHTTTCLELYPYGPTSSDSTLSSTNDYAASMTLDRSFPFGEKYHSLIWISDNGVISFEDAVFMEQDSSLFRTLPYFYDVDGDGNANEQPDSILPFWADVDITSNGGGNIYYRESTASSITSRATDDVRSYFRSNLYFSAQSVIIVTWESVSFFDQQSVGDVFDPRNTFQAVLITDGQESFVFYLYEKIEWVVGTRMGGDQETGLGDNGAAVVGFLWNDGNTDTKIYSERTNLLQLPASSNLIESEAGVFAYKVDGAELIGPACTTDSTNFAITPAQSGMMGGEKIYLLGPCWDSAYTYTCVFSYNDQELQRVNATVTSINNAYCVPDPFYLVGEVDLEVLGGPSGTHTTTYSLIESGRIDPTVERQSSDSTSWQTAGNSLRVTWDADSFVVGTFLTVSVLAYREDAPLGPRWDTVYVIANDTDEDDGSLTFTPMAQYDVTSENAFGVIRITANTDSRERVLWSDIHALGYLLEEAYQTNTTEWASEKCTEWMQADDLKPSFTQNLPACPCTLDQAIQDVGTFITDPTCFQDGGSDTCSDNEGAVHCVLSAYAKMNAYSGTKCCYDDEGLLMYAGDTKYAGMSGRCHVRGAEPYLMQNYVPEMSHWSQDLIAYHFCCNWGQEKDCFEYRERRPTSDCVAYEPPKIALSFGDPHFITMDMNNYTFQGIGEFTLLRYASGPNGAFDFELQGRQVQSKDINNNNIGVTQLASVAMKDSDSDTIYIEASESSGMDVYRKAPGQDAWTSVYFSQQTFTDLQECAVGVTKFEREVEIYGLVVMFKTTGIAILVTYDYGMLGVQPILPAGLNSDNLYGLLGNMNGDPEDDLKRRDSNTVISNPTEQDIHDFGLTWEVETDYELFYYTGETKHSDYQNNTFVPTLDVTLTALYPECQEVEQCLYDYTVSDKNPALAAATLGTYQAFEESLENIVKINVCPFVTTPFNGTKSYSSSTNKYLEGAEVTFDCRDGLILVGSSFMRCEYNEETLGWSVLDASVQCIYSICGVISTPQNGSISLSNDALTATFSCDDGFTMNGASQSLCTDGAWTNNAPSCNSGSSVNVVGIAVGVTISVIVVIVLVVLGLLYYNSQNKKKSTSNSNKAAKAKSYPKTTEDRDAELAVPLNRPPNDNSGSAAGTTSSTQGDPKSAAIKIYAPTPMTQASVKYNPGSDPSKKPATTTSSASKDVELAEEANVNPVNATADEAVIDMADASQTQSAPPPQHYETPRTPEQAPKSADTTPKKDESKSSKFGWRNKKKDEKQQKSEAPPTSTNGSSSSAAPPSTPKSDAEVVKGTGKLANTNISGSGGWI